MAEAVKNNAKSVSCAFCGRAGDEAGAIVAGAAASICGGCVEQCARLIAAAPNAAAGAPTPLDWPQDAPTEQILSHLANQEVALEGVRAQARAMIEVLRRRAVSWEKIGKALGCSRQAAWERFG